MIKISAEDMIDEAICVLQDGGWIRGHAHTNEGYCTLGALAQARRFLVMRMMRSHGGELDADVWTVASQAYSDALGRILQQINGCSTYLSSVPNWNDNLARDADEVIEMLKLAKEQQL